MFAKQETEAGEEEASQRSHTRRNGRRELNPLLKHRLGRAPLEVTVSPREVQLPGWDAGEDQPGRSAVGKTWVHTGQSAREPREGPWPRVEGVHSRASFLDS